MYSFPAVLQLVKELKDEAKTATAHCKKPSGETDVPKAADPQPGPSTKTTEPQPGPSTHNSPTLDPVEGSNDDGKRNTTESAAAKEAADVAKAIGNYHILILNSMI